MCGGTDKKSARKALRTGLSPRVRGNLALSARISASTVYPRVCGGTIIDKFVVNGETGLSPRVRGNLPADARRRTAVGSIPACAGEPSMMASYITFRWVYPRVCGGTVLGGLGAGQNRGLSPRVRGNRGNSGCSNTAPRSIPACAGEPDCSCGFVCYSAVYPRVCGGTFLSDPLTRSLIGLSPRVRGNPHVQWIGGTRKGSIPACAGEPVELGAYEHYEAGLSPRVRGNLLLM